jgi:hypothetical protein
MQFGIKLAKPGIQINLMKISKAAWLASATVVALACTMYFTA